VTFKPTLERELERRLEVWSKIKNML